jgi:hypothetical protein
LGSSNVILSSVLLQIIYVNSIVRKEISDSGMGQFKLVLTLQLKKEAPLLINL